MFVFFLALLLLPLAFLWRRRAAKDKAAARLRWWQQLNEVDDGLRDSESFVAR